LADIETAPFLQDFEGEVRWAADFPWSITTATDGEAGHSSSHAWEDSPFGSESANYLPNARRQMVAAIDFSAINHPVLRFKHRYTFEASGQAWGGLYFSTDNTNWVLIHSFFGSQVLWSGEEFDLSFMRDRAPGYIMFQLVSNNSAVVRDGWHLDDIEVYDDPTSHTFPFTDKVEDEASTLSHWIPDGWYPALSVGHNDDLAWAYDRTISGQPAQYLTLKGTIDLSVSNTPNITYWARTEGSGGNFFWVEASGNGGKTWERASQINTVQVGDWVQLEAPL
jgi:hypothetical protein